MNLTNATEQDMMDTIEYYAEPSDPEDDDDNDSDPGPRGPLGLINGDYDIKCPALDQWDDFSGEEFTLSISLSGTSVWAKYDFGMHYGIMYMPQRPYSSSREKIPFEWRGRDRSEEQMDFGPDNKGWIRFLGNGEI